MMNYGLFLQHASAATVATVISHTAVRGLKKAKKKVAEELSAQQLDEFKDVFADLEKDGDGSVTTKGFETSTFFVQNDTVVRQGNRMLSKTTLQRAFFSQLNSTRIRIPCHEA